MSRVLAHNVWVGETLCLAGSTPPKEIAEQITNPKAWGETEEKPVKGDDAEKSAPEKKPAARKSGK